ncbi:DUF3006 domain-containing protein [Planococcus maritimus]|nr:DUF3006 domain-containing protein [Planococcus sp. SK3692]MDE4085367.1 DUF3006 domain-containing protein [Planococcus maritimus]
MKPLKGIIDRFEEDIAVVEIDGVTKDFPKHFFPTAAKPGDFVEINGNEVAILHEETEQRRKEIEELMDELWED